MRSKLKIIIPIAAAVIAIIIALLFINFTSKEKSDIDSLMSSAQKYLVDNQYEQAIAEFKKVIDIDPMNADAYLGMADAYIGIGDTDSAVEALKKGYALTGDERLKKMLDELTGGSAEAEAPETTAAETAATVPESGSEEITVTTEEAIYIASLDEIPGNVKKLAIVGPDIPDYTLSYNRDHAFVICQLDEPLTNIDFISQFNELESLDLSYNQISDISILSGFTDLTFLRMMDNQISDISPLSGLTNLTSLNLQANMISDISPLSGLTDLTSLYMSGNQISDISPLRGLTNLTSLGMTINQISDISPLSGLTNLFDIGLQQNQISDISALSGLTDLIQLDLNYNQISDISPLSGLTDLTALYLQNNPVSLSDIEALEKVLPDCVINY